MITVDVLNAFRAVSRSSLPWRPADKLWQGFKRTQRKEGPMLVVEVLWPHSQLSVPYAST